jgi:hypothetical protein
MSRINLAGEPQLSGSHLSWAGVVDPGTFESASDIVDQVDCFRLTANDPAGLDVTSDVIMQAQITTSGPILPGDTYQQGIDLAELYDGYYHVLLTLDGDATDCEVYKLHVRVESGMFELKTWHRHM